MKRDRGFSLIETVYVVALTGVIAAIAIPASGNLIAGLRLSGDARTLSNTASVAKMRAASDFSQARVFMDLTTGSYHVETWQKNPAAWISDGSTMAMSSNVVPGSLAFVNPPPNTQAAIGQAPNCLTAAGAAIGNTACIVFNSRGVPVDAAGTPTNGDAYYINDGTTVYSLTVSATGFVQLWRSNLAGNAWIKQ